MKKNKKSPKGKAKAINSKMSFSELLKKHPELAQDLFEEGMHCVGCPMAAGENLEQGAIAHGINPKKLVDKLNKKVKGGKK
jgi:hybrid cluster-associated redox disulfide protein